MEDRVIVTINGKQVEVLSCTVVKQVSIVMTVIDAIKIIDGVERTERCTAHAVLVSRPGGMSLEVWPCEGLYESIDRIGLSHPEVDVR